MAEAFDRDALAGEKLAVLHTALSRCCVAWTNLARLGGSVALTPAQAMEMADFFAKSAAETAGVAVLMGFALVPMPPKPAPEQQPTAQGKRRLAVIEGGKKQ